MIYDGLNPIWAIDKCDLLATLDCLMLSHMKLVFHKAVFLDRYSL